MALNPMSVAKLKVVRKSDMGAFLDAQTGNSTDDILLHKNQQTQDVNIGDEVEVFLYHDRKKRLTASMNVPKMKEGQIARVKVINKTEDGAFLDVGAERGIFMPFREMRGKPEIGDTVWAKLYTDKSGKLAMTMNVSDEMRRASKPASADEVKRGDSIKGTIFNITDAGAFLLSDERYIVFITRKEIPCKLKLGEEVTARVTFIREDGRINASLREQKEKALLSDAEKIFRYMKETGGTISDKMSPEMVYRHFQISKAAYKRALGHLYKEHKIQRKEDGFNIELEQ